MQWAVIQTNPIHSAINPVRKSTDYLHTKPGLLANLWLRISGVVLGVRALLFSPDLPNNWFFSIRPVSAYKNNGASTSVTVASSLINTCRDGPAVSLNGSPTVSPTTAALCASERLPP